MKKFLLAAVFAILGMSASYAQTTGEIVAGINLSDMSELDSKIGFHIGARGEIMLPSVCNGFYANGAALITLKGAEKDYGRELDFNCNAYYLEIPIHAGYKYVLDDDLAFFGEFGPYFSIGLFGKSKLATEDESIKVDTFSEDGGVKRFDFGLGFRLGTEINKHFTASVGYDFGLVDVADDEYDESPSIKNSNLYVSFGYKF